MTHGAFPYFRTKPVETILAESQHKEGGLRRVLTAWDLTALGVGAIIGTGIFVLTGVAAATKAGPAIMLSFVFAGFACIFSALCYAEFAARLPISGSAYTYAYATIGELLAWIIGWDLILEYTIGAAAVAVGWSKYFEKFLGGFPALHISQSFFTPHLFGFEVNPFAGVIILLITALLAVGIKESSRFNAVIVVVKLAVVLLVIFAGIPWVRPENWSPFFPFGVNGIFVGAAYIFFAYIGFDAISTTAEETINPQRDLPIGIIASLLICTVLYVAVAAVLTGMVPYNHIDHGAPLAAAFGAQGFAGAKILEKVIAFGALAGLTTVLLVLLMSQPRMYYSMARDGLFFPVFAKIHPKFGTPFLATIITGCIAAAMACFVPLDELAELVNIGTIFAFIIVCSSVLIMRYKSPTNPTRGSLLLLVFVASLLLGGFAFRYQWAPPSLWLSLAVALVTAGMIATQKTVNLPETFRCPWVPLLPLLGIACNVYMMINLDPPTWYRLLWWLAVGLVVYSFYGIWHSKLRTPSDS